MRTRALLAALAAVGLLASGCGAGDRADPPSATAKHSGHDEPSMAGMDMGSAEGPSDPASMICGREIGDAVKRTFAMTRQPTSKHTWAASDRVYSCSWAVPRGTLEMSVQDSVELKAGRAYFDKLRGSVAGARTINGMESFGFPAFSTVRGDTVFLKDGKTLRVDASSLPQAALPPGFSRSEVSYGVAAAVIACWSE